MVWHIVKKDWRLLRWLVVVVVALHAITALAQLGPAGGLPAFMVTSLLIVLLVHQDALPGVRQDWLVRPIRHADLLLAKLLFVLVTVHAPLVALDITQGLANGFTPGATIGAALWRSGYMLFVFSVPVLGLAALTKSMTEVAVALAAWFTILLALTAFPGLAGWTAPTARTGVAWVPETTRQLLLLAGALAVLGIQYFRRWTPLARGVFVAAVVVSQSAQFIPWSVAFAMQEPLSPGEGEAGDLALSFDPGIGPFRPAPGQNVNDVEERPGFGPADAEAENQRRRAEGAVTVFLPLRISGLPARSSLVADRSRVRLVDQAGEVIFAGTGNALEVLVDDSPASGITAHHGLRMPRDVYNAVSARPVRLEVDYSLTRFRQEIATTMPALGGDLHAPGVGRCTTQLTRTETAVELRCVKPGELPSCVTVQLQHAASGRENPDVSLCAPNYRPFPGHVLPDAMSRFRGLLPFADPVGLARYPVDGAQLSASEVVIRSYEPREHRVQRLIVPEFHLDAWRPASPPAVDVQDAASQP